MKTFQEQFPSLLDVPHRRVMCSDGNPSKLVTFNSDYIQAHCLDKQRVREVLDIFLAKINISYDDWVQLKKELEL